jgi:Rad3-related DNA helicase
MLELSVEDSKVILNELVLGDGHNGKVKNMGRAAYTTSSITLAHDVRELAFRADFYPGMLKMEADTTFGYEVNYRVQYRTSSERRHNSYALRKGNTILLKVREVCRRAHDGEVYDLTTRQSQSFSTANAVVHNCTTKQLQQQLLHDFPYARTLKGRNNYVCLKFKSMYPRVTAEECTKSETNQCDQEHQCPYMVAKNEALRAPLAVLNTSYFLTEANYVGTFSDQEMIVVDEADTLEEHLMSFVDVTITQKQLNELQIAEPKYKTKFESWVQWANEAVSVLRPRLSSIQNELESSWATTDFELMREAKKLSRLVGKLSFFVNEVDKNWVWSPQPTQWSFKPVWVAKYAENSFWKHSKKVLMMSATILDYMQVSRNIGLDVMKVAYKALPSPFPKENRPVYLDYAASVSNKTMQDALPKLVVKIRNILDTHPDEKILIHCVTYKIKDYLMQYLDKKRTMSHSTFDREAVLEAFKQSQHPRVLLSPSMDRGVDLPGDLCRVVVIAKVPFADLGDPQISKRVHASRDGNTWYIHKAVSKIIQMSGRAVRSKDDWASCVVPSTKILTSDLMWLPVGSLDVGRGVLCFDEYPLPVIKVRRRFWRVGKVVATGTRVMPCYSIELENGDVLTSTVNHKWLIRIANSVVWQDTIGITEGMEFLKFINLWELGNSFAHGWLSGFSDGEGCYSRGLGNRNPDVQGITIVQNAGVALEQAKNYLAKLGFSYGESPKGNGYSLTIAGGLEEKLRFLGEVRPVRLLDKFMRTEFSSEFKAMKVIRVKKVRRAGFIEVTTLQVDRGTYIAEGYGAHNTYILDEQFERVYSENRRMFPTWWREAIVR